MMQLPGRLSRSTLGDLLGSLHRARVTGTVELCETAGPGRVHRVHLRGGLVAAVETTLPAPPILRERLEALFSIRDARVAFRIARPLDALAPPLGPADFLHGRPRARDRERASADEPPRSGRRPLPEAPIEDPASRARRLLGVPEGAALVEVRRAFRRLAGAVHPDRLGSGSADDRDLLAARFAELSAAYHLLVA